MQYFSSWRFPSCGRLLRAANIAAGILHEAHFVPAACERIEQHEAPCQRLADTRGELDGFQGLERPDDPDQWCKHAERGASLFAFHRRVRAEAVVARRIPKAQVEYGDLPIEANARARDQGLAFGHAGAIERMARDEVVGAVEH